MTEAQFPSPLFDPIRPLCDAIPAPHAGMLDALNQLAATRLLRERFVDASIDDGLHYEERIATRSLIATRDNWHDLFNALAWLTYPRTKAVISATHWQFLQSRGDLERQQRSRERDVLTLFDEGGMVVLSSDDSLLELLCGFQWKNLFWHRRNDVQRNMRFLMFGHAMFDSARNPYVGITARAVLFSASQQVIDQSMAQQVAHADERLAEHLSKRENIARSQQLQPVPFLGIPGWYDANIDEHFYDNTDYFRPGRGFRKQRTAPNTESTPTRAEPFR